MFSSYLFRCNVLPKCRQFSVQSKLDKSVKKYTVKQWEQPEGYDTGIKVANSYAAVHKKTLVPLIVKDPQNITWYSCGPTVYDSMHIGHACAYVRFDAIRRILTNFFDFHVKMAMGVTDVDDKIISRAQLLGKEMHLMAEEYDIEFQKNLCELNVVPPFQYMRVSDFIPEMINFVQKLLHSGHSYRTEDGSVWFDFHHFTDVGRLSKILEAMEDDNFGGPNQIKRTKSKRDFAVWKAAKPGEPYWDAPWGKGRPGWHIECSTVGSLIFGSNMDIHSGGRDLYFPHHECELLQSEAYHGCSQWVNYFLHSGQLNLVGEATKMSKSLGNTISISDFLKQWSSDHFRMFVLSDNWCDAIEFKPSLITNMDKDIIKKRQFLSECNEYINGTRDADLDSVQALQNLNRLKKDIKIEFCNNFNTPQVLKLLKKFEDRIAENLNKEPEKIDTKPRDPDCIQEVMDYLEDVYLKLGFKSLRHDYSQDPNYQKLNEVIKVSSFFQNQMRLMALNGVKSSNDAERKQAQEILTQCDKLRTEYAKNVIKLSYHLDGQHPTWTMNL